MVSAFRVQSRLKSVFHLGKFVENESTYVTLLNAGALGRISSFLLCPLNPGKGRGSHPDFGPTAPPGVMEGTQQ